MIFSPMFVYYDLNSEMNATGRYIYFLNAKVSIKFCFN